VQDVLETTIGDEIGKVWSGTPPGFLVVYVILPGGVASLNHLLMADKPPACSTTGRLYKTWSFVQRLD